MITFKDSTENIREENLAGFFVAWPNPPTQAKHMELLEKSTYRWMAIDDETNQVVGFITAIGDQVLSSYIPLLEVLPEYKGKGIGSQLVENMLDTLKEYYMIDLLCDKGVVPFYSKFQSVTGEGVDFKVRMIEAQGMITRNYGKQSGI